ncbi:hypothetical protein B0H14DRAFT_2654638 [Mycena olivaceomarginata]|nr:hypothetical protein B0H14DRAFT_2654638 [Mycena olivaceomarginata]
MGFRVDRSSDLLVVTTSVTSHSTWQWTSNWRTPCLVSVPSETQCVSRWVEIPDLGRRDVMNRTSARRVLPSDDQCVPRWVDSPDFERYGPYLCALATSSAPPAVHQSPGRLGLRAVSSRQMPSSGPWTPCCMDRTSARRVLPSDAQCVPRWVNSPDFGCRVAMDRTSARRVLPSHAQCVPRLVDSPDFERRVAMDRSSAPRLRRLRHPPPTAHQSLGRLGLRAVSSRQMPNAQCVPRWVDSPDFGHRVVWTVPLRAVSSRQMPSVCLDGSTVWTLDAVLPWTVPMRAVSSRQMPTTSSAPPAVHQSPRRLGLRAVSSRQMPSVCLDGSTVRTLDALFVITNSDPDTIDVADDTRLDCCLVHIYSINESIRLSPTRPIAPPRAFFAANPRLIREQYVHSIRGSVCASKGGRGNTPPMPDHGHVPHLEPAKYRGCKAFASHQSPHAKIYGILAIPTLRSRRQFYKDSVSEEPDIEVALIGEVLSSWSGTIRQEKGHLSQAARYRRPGVMFLIQHLVLRTHALARESQFSFLLFGFKTPKNSHLDSYYENVLRDNLYNAASVGDLPVCVPSDRILLQEDPMKPALDRVSVATT